MTITVNARCRFHVPIWIAREPNLADRRTRCEGVKDTILVYIADAAR